MNKRTKSIIFTSSLCVIAITLGSLLGYFIGSRTVSFEANSDEVIRDSQEEIYNKLNTRLFNEKEPSNFNVDELLENNKSFTISDIINYSLYKINFSHDNVLSLSLGTSTTSIANQVIHGAYIKNNNNYFVESLSYSTFAKPAIRMYGTSDNNQFSTTVYETESTGEFSAQYTNAEINDNLDNQQIKSQYGRLVNNPLIYIISNDSLIGNTVVNGTTYETKIEKNAAKDGYFITTALNAAKSTVDYRIQMCSTTEMDKNTDGLPIKPVFNSVALTFELDLNLNIKRIRAYEQYKVSKFGWNDMYGTMNTVFRYENDSLIQKIPSLEEMVNYKLMN